MTDAVTFDFGDWCACLCAHSSLQQLVLGRVSLTPHTAQFAREVGSDSDTVCFVTLEDPASIAFALLAKLSELFNWRAKIF